MPTPRPETSVVVSAVEKPGMKISSTRLRVGQRVVRADEAALARLGEDLCGVQAATVVAHFDTMLPPRCEASRRSEPKAGLPSDLRTSGFSMP